MLKILAILLIKRAEKRLGVALDYTRHIAQTDIGLLTRYNRIFGFLDPNLKTTPLAYHAARLRGAIAADCGTCVEAEINLAKLSKLDKQTISDLITGNYEALPPEIIAVAELTDAVTARREDAPQAREIVRQQFGEEGLIELSYAMNGAALLPGIKRAMGYATACDLGLMANLAKGKT
ncbi:MAG: hypothetical protein COB78_02235 [Hyphomicrobiales bacterium]|nr:MAG: hypothetical protein COB78_02235 [Hyphomicrobiales bacterium]